MQKRGIFSNILSPDALEISKRDPKRGLLFRKAGNDPKTNILDYDGRLIRDRLAHYYICIPRPNNAMPDETPAPTERMLLNVVALDPRVCTFQTTYSTQGMISEWCNDQNMGRLFTWKTKCDRVQSLLDQSKSGFILNKQLRKQGTGDTSMALSFAEEAITMLM